MQFPTTEIRYSEKHLRIFVIVRSDVPQDHDDYIYIASAQFSGEGGWTGFLKKNRVRAVYAGLKRLPGKREKTKWGLTEAQVQKRIKSWRQRAARDGLTHSTQFEGL